MATSIELTPDAEKRLDFLASQTGRSKDFYLRDSSNAALKTWKTTTLPQTYWNASAKGRRRYIQPPQ